MAKKSKYFYFVLNHENDKILFGALSYAIRYFTPALTRAGAELIN